MTNIFAYTRVSTDDQTCENQRRTITAAKYNVSRWYSDDGVSGAVLAAQRPAMASLLAYVRKDDTVVVAAIDRLGRNTIDVLSTVEALTAKGVSVISIREGFDLFHRSRQTDADDASGGRGTGTRKSQGPSACRA